ncbi:MAG: response regulator [Candidatus Acidiferrales bacterium]
MGKLRRQLDPNKPPAATLLVVDDEPQNVDLMVDVFENAGYAATGVGSGAEALEKIRTHRPDAVLLDLIMPGMDGFEVLRRLRADADIRHTPVMVITAMHVDDAGRDFLAQNAQSIFQKGAFWIDDLLKGVERIIADARGSHDARRASS